MKSSRKLVMFVLVVAAAWLGSSALFSWAQQPTKPVPRMVTQVPPQQGVPEHVPTVATDPIGMNVPPTTAVDSDALMATYHFRATSVQIVDGFAVVHAQAVLSDKQHKDVYAWKLAFLDAQREVIDETLYDHQTFPMEADSLMDPTFDEMTPIPAGARFVRVSVLAFRPGTSRTKLLDRKNAHNFTVISNSLSL